MTILRRGATREPGPPGRRTPADRWNERGAKAALSGRIDMAEAAWVKAIKANRDHLEAAFNLALLSWRTGRISDDAAESVVRQIVACNPSDWLGHYLFALLQLERDHPGEALESLRKIPAVDAGILVPEALAEATCRLPHSAGLLAAFDADCGQVTAVAVSDDGSRLLTGGFDGTVSCWTTKGQKRLWKVDVHKSWITGVRHARSGIVSTGRDSTVRILDPDSGTILSEIEGHKDQLLSLSVSPDGRFALSAGFEGKALLWNLETRTCLQELRSKGWVIATALAEELALTSSMSVPGESSNRELLLWDCKSGTILESLKGHTEDVTALAIDHSGHIALSGSRDGRILVWDLKAREIQRQLAGQSGAVLSIALDPKGDHAISGCGDGSLRYWNVATGQCVRTFHESGSRIWAVAFNSATAAAGDEDGMARIFKLPVGSRYRAAFAVRPRPEKAAGFEVALNLAQEAAERVDLLSAAHHLRTARDLSGRGREPEGLALQRTLHRCLPRGRFRGGWEIANYQDRHAPLVYSRDGLYALSKLKNNKLCWWEVSSGRIVNPPATSPAFIVRSGAHSQEVDIFALRDGQLVRMHRHGETATWTISPDDRFVLSGDNGGTLSLWHTATGRSLRRFRGHTGGRVRGLGLTGDGNVAVSGGFDRAIRVWSLLEGKCLRLINDAHRIDIGSLVVSEDGRLAASGGYGIKIWDLQTGETRREMKGHTEDVIHLCLSRDGRVLLSSAHSQFFGGHDFSVRLWDTESGDCLQVLEGHRSVIGHSWLSPDALYALSAAEDGIRVWMFDWELVAPADSGWERRATEIVDLFLSQRTPYCLEPTEDPSPPEGILRLALKRFGKPRWTTEDLPEIRNQLADIGLGWVDEKAVLKLVEKRIRAKTPAAGEPCPEMIAVEDYERSLRAAKQAKDPVTRVRHLRAARGCPGFERALEAAELWLGLYDQLPRDAPKVGWRAFQFHRGPEFSDCHFDGIGGLCVDEVGQWAVSNGTRDGKLILWNLAKRRFEKSFYIGKSEELLLSLALVPHQRLATFIVASGKQREVRLFDIKKSGIVASWAAPLEMVAPLHDGKRVASLDLEGNLEIRDLHSGVVQAVLGQYPGSASRGLTPCGSRLLSWGRDRTNDWYLQLWRTSDGQCLRTMSTGVVLTARMTPDGTRAVIGGPQGLEIVSLETGEHECMEGPHAALLEITPDGRSAISHSGYRIETPIQTWDLARRKLGPTLYSAEHLPPLAALAITPDGKWALTGAHGVLIAWFLDFELIEQKMTDWDEAARPFLVAWIERHAPGSARITRRTVLKEIMPYLRRAGFGYLNAEGVRRELDRLIKTMQ